MPLVKSFSSKRFGFRPFHKRNTSPFNSICNYHLWLISNIFYFRKCFFQFIKIMTVYSNYMPSECRYFFYNIFNIINVADEHICLIFIMIHYRCYIIDFLVSSCLNRFIYLAFLEFTVTS